MRNEGYKNGAIELIFAVVFLLVMTQLPTKIAIVADAIFLICLLIYFLKKQQQRRNFPVFFTRPDEDLTSMISNFYKQMQYEIEAERKSITWEYYVVFIPLIILTIVFFILSKENKLFLIFPAIIVFLVVVMLLTEFVMNHNVDSKLKRSSSTDFKVAKVEYYDESYDIHGRSAKATYYVFVRKNGETLKLRVSGRSYSFAVEEKVGEGYLIKLDKGDGVFDVFDFIPVMKEREHE